MKYASPYDPLHVLFLPHTSITCFKRLHFGLLVKSSSDGIWLFPIKMFYYMSQNLTWQTASGSLLYLPIKIVKVHSKSKHAVCEIAVWSSVLLDTQCIANWAVLKAILGK